MTQNISFKKNTPLFWDINSKGKVNILTYRLKQFLELYGFGQYQSDKERTSLKSIFRNDDGLLQIHDSQSIKKWVREFLEEIPEEKFVEFFPHPCARDDYYFSVLQSWQDFDTPKITKVILDTKIHSEEGFAGTETINLFNDKEGTCHIRFSNGVVKITNKEIEIIDGKKLKDSGAVWESEIIPHNIKLDHEDKGAFAEYCNLSMRRHNPKKKNKDWWQNYEFNSRSNEEYESLRRAYGFLIHSHNTTEDKKCIFFIDQDSSKDRTDGQNGKSRILSSIKYYKKDAYQDGRRFRQGMSSGERFQFTNVDVNTKFVWIDDVKPEFKFELLFSILTGPMEVERKTKDKFIISTSKKPKFGITTNHIIPQTGVSYDARMHIVEFGNYLSKQKSLGETDLLKKQLGKLLPDNDYISYDEGFAETDWNDFFNYGFRCVKQYFNQGLVASPNSTYRTKAIVASIEGDRGEGVVDWIDNWIVNVRVKKGHHLHENGGILEDKLYEEFARENPLLVDKNQGGGWNKSRFLEAVYKWVKSKDGFFYNEHKSSRGEGRTKRRWLVGESGNQKPAILITSTQDNQIITKSSNPTQATEPTTDDDDDDDFDVNKFFGHLAKS